MRVYIKQEGQVFQELSPVWSVVGDQGNQWFRGAISVPEMRTNFQIVVEGLRGNNYVGDSAIDDVSLRQTECQAEEPINVTDSCVSRCGMSDSTPAVCDCDEDCEINSTCCNDYWNTCAALDNKNTSNVLPENENEEDNNIPISNVETESSEREVSTTNITTLPTTKAILTDASSTTILPTTSATTTSSHTSYTTLKAIISTSTPTKINPTTVLITTPLNPTNMEMMEHPFFFTTPFEEGIATGYYESPMVSEDSIVTTEVRETDDNVPLMTEHQLVTELPEEEMIPPITTQVFTERAETPTNLPPISTENASQLSTTNAQPITNTNTAPPITTTNAPRISNSVPTSSNTESLSTEHITLMPDIITLTTSIIPEVLQSESSKVTIKPDNTISSTTTSTVSSTTSYQNSTSTIPNHPSSVEAMPNDKSFTSIPPETDGGTSHETENAEDEEVKPAKWDGMLSDSSGSRPKEKPTTGFSSEKKPKEPSPNYIVLGLGSAAGVLALGLVVGLVLYFVIHRRSKPQQNNLEDDSEMRYLPQSEMVEMAIPTDS